MVVIPSFNGADYIHEQLYRFKKCAPEERLIVVDTKSTDPKSKLIVQTECGLRDVEFAECEGDEHGYESGALKKAFALHPDEPFYMTVHDSLWIKSQETMPMVHECLRSHDVVAWHFFMQEGSGWDSQEQRDWLVRNFGTDQYYMGIYGQVFAAKNEQMRRLLERVRDIRVDSKDTTMGMERAWPIVMGQLGMSILFLEHYKGPLFSDNYRYFMKAPRDKSGPYAGARM